jgi:predicted ATP-binding protein involved in virulence
MYIDNLSLTNFRTFRKSRIDFVHPDQDFKKLGIPEPKLNNVNLLLGNNGLGKTTLLKAIALSALGPAVGDSGINADRLVRREPEPVARQSTKKAAKKQKAGEIDRAVLEAEFTTHPQDRTDSYKTIESRVEVVKRVDLEGLRWTHTDEKPWHPIFHSSSDAFFFVGYGATRRVEKRERVDMGSRKSSSFDRAQRVQSLFEEAYSLLPLSNWLPAMERANPGRHKQVCTLINKLMGKGHFTFTGEMEKGEYLFERGGLHVPFPALSDGYRAFLGWVGDLLYHICMTAPAGKRLDENCGMVMVDEIDLHLHPKWQMTVLHTLASELPKIQFIATSHSPLLVGSLEWMNIIVMESGPKQSSVAKRIEMAVHGLDADQVLLTDFFGMATTRSSSRLKELNALSRRAAEGDEASAKELLKQMTRGKEAMR